MQVPCPGKLKVRNFVAFSVTYLVLYIYPNMHPGIVASELPLWWLDRITPLIPWSFLVYTSDYLLFVFVILLLDDLDKFKAFTRYAFGVLIISGAFFILMPTEYPRPAYPQTSNLLVAWMMKLVSTADTPKNCFPSMHVGLTAIGAWSMRFKGPRVFALFCIWAVAIFISTITTKQHYFVDILGGFTVAFAVVVAHWALYDKKVLQAVLKLC